MIVTIDGPAGAGKSTAARHLATALGVSFLDTGATYRAVTLRAMDHGVDLTDEQALAAEARDIELHLEPLAEGTRVWMDGRDVSRDIRGQDVTANARYAASSPVVREVLVGLQRQIGRNMGSFVTEGRDQGTVVFPDADVKFYLTADLQERARRRAGELCDSGEQADEDAIAEALRQRDDSDRNRAVGPLRIPEDAVIVDTTACSQQETLDLLLRQVRERT